MLLPLEKNVQKVTARPVTTVTLQEESLNTYVKEKVAAVARKLGYIVVTNRSSIIIHLLTTTVALQLLNMIYTCVVLNTTVDL